jgi:hypothetical protein
MKTNEVGQPGALAPGSCSAIDGAPPPLAYQPQHFWSDGDFDGWVNIGAPTISKRVTRDRLALFLDIHPGEKVRVLKIASSAEVLDAEGFLPAADDRWPKLCSDGTVLHNLADARAKAKTHPESFSDEELADWPSPNNSAQPRI